jgi:hypothetical protein
LKIFKFFASPIFSVHLGGPGESSNEGLCFLDADLRLQGKLLDGNMLQQSSAEGRKTRKHTTLITLSY